MHHANVLFVPRILQQIHFLPVLEGFFSPPTLTVQPPLGVFHAPHTAARTPVFMMQLEVLRRSPVVRGEPGDASVDHFGHGCVAAAVIQFDAGCAENRG